jgi:hypothetical protein
VRSHALATRPPTLASSAPRSSSRAGRGSPHELLLAALSLATPPSPVSTVGPAPPSRLASLLCRATAPPRSAPMPLPAQRRSQSSATVPLLAQRRRAPPGPVPLPAPSAGRGVPRLLPGPAPACSPAPPPAPHASGGVSPPASSASPMPLRTDARRHVTGSKWVEMVPLIRRDRLNPHPRDIFSLHVNSILVHLEPNTGSSRSDLS